MVPLKSQTAEYTTSAVLDQTTLPTVYGTADVPLCLPDIHLHDGNLVEDGTVVTYTWKLQLTCTTGEKAQRRQAGPALSHELYPTDSTVFSEQSAVSATLEQGIHLVL